MVKDHSDRKRVNPLPPLHGLLFPISTKKYLLYVPLHRQDSYPLLWVIGLLNLIYRENM